MLRRRWLFPIAVVFLLGQMAFAMLTTAMEQSPTIDEPVYVATAEVYAQQHSLRYNPEHPPLGKLFIAAGMAFGDVKLDPPLVGNQTRVGAHVLYEAGNDPQRVLLLARIPIILLTLGFGVVVFFFARDLAGAWGGLVALALYGFSPDLIAHGSLATLDVAAAGLMLTSFWLLWRARRRPHLYLPLAGLALGAALATRMSALAAVPAVLGLAWLAPAVVKQPNRWRDWGVRALAAIGVGLVAVGVVWIVYLAVDPHLRYTPPAWLTNPGGKKGLIADLAPFPKAYKDGMLLQFRYDNKNFKGFLLGDILPGKSPWYYLPVALVIKTPLGMMALWLAGAITMLVKPALRIAAVYVLAPATVLMLAAMTVARPYGVRYVIFVPMLLAVAAATVTQTRVRWAWAGTAALAGFVAVSSAMTFPYYLPYSNEAFGGTSKTHLRLHDSNVDWGQDLGRLATRLKEKYSGEQVWLAYKGGGDPAYYGITGRSPLSVRPEQVRGGILVVSDSRVAVASVKFQSVLDAATPIDQVGHSITIYRLRDPEPVQRPPS